MRRLRVDVRDHDQSGCDGERNQRDLPVEHEEDRRRRDDGEDVLPEEDEAVPEEEPDLLEVHCCPRHELSRLVAVVEAPREAQKVGVERVSDVELDSERLSAGDEPAADEHERADESGDGDEGDEDGQSPAVVRPDAVVDHLPGQPRDGEAGNLRPHREDDRDDERPPVRAQEAEKPAKRPKVRVRRADSVHKVEFSGRLTDRFCRETAANMARFGRHPRAFRR